MAHKRIDITSADTKQVGFDYQYLYFMDRLLQLSPGDEIGYEALDDVHVISSTTGETAYIQTKHTIDLSSDGTLVNLLPFRSYTPALPQHLEMQPFAKELFEIDAIGLDNLGLAELADFTTAFLSLRNQLSDWYDEGKIDASTVKKFHDNAFEIWKSLHRGSHRATKKDNALDQNNALSCFDEVMKKELKILETELGISLSRGEFIMLANEEEIGWKYMWCEKWSVKGVNDDFPLF